MDSLEGFLLVTTADGDIVFISENVNRYLGLQQVMNDLIWRIVDEIFVKITYLHALSSVLFLRILYHAVVIGESKCRRDDVE